MSQNVGFVVKVILWYLCSSYFNVYNKILLQKLPFPCFLALFQCFVTICMVSPVYSAKLLKLKLMDFSKICWGLRYVALFSCISNVTGTMAVHGGSIHLAQTIRAAEPLFTSVVYVLYSKKPVSYRACASFVVIVFGAIVASNYEVQYSLSTLLSGVISNGCAGVRTVLAKEIMKESANDSILNSKSLYIFQTFVSCLILVPATLLIEGRAIGNHWLSNHQYDSLSSLSYYLILTGVLFHAYNEFSFQALDQLKSPISFAIANTFRRVAIIVISVVALNSSWTVSSMIGTSISMLGVFLYAAFC